MFHATTLARKISGLFSHKKYSSKRQYVLLRLFKRHSIKFGDNDDLIMMVTMMAMLIMMLTMMTEDC